jgi:hypothetical protein
LLPCWDIAADASWLALRIMNADNMLDRNVARCFACLIFGVWLRSEVSALAACIRFLKASCVWIGDGLMLLSTLGAHFLTPIRRVFDLIGCWWGRLPQSSRLTSGKMLL